VRESEREGEKRKEMREWDRRINRWERNKEIERKRKRVRERERVRASE
jgi:hypothetical protein